MNYKDINEMEKVTGGAMPTEYHCDANVGKYYEDASLSANEYKTMEPCVLFTPINDSKDPATGVVHNGCRYCKHYKEGR